MTRQPDGAGDDAAISELRKRDEPKLGGIFVDFVVKGAAHWRKFGGGRGEAVAKAVGIKRRHLPDGSMPRWGWGAMRLCWRPSVAACGCKKRERNLVVAALLDDLSDAAAAMRWLLAAGFRSASVLIHASSLLLR